MGTRRDVLTRDEFLAQDCTLAALLRRLLAPRASGLFFTDPESGEKREYVV